MVMTIPGKVDLMEVGVQVWEQQLDTSSYLERGEFEIARAVLQWGERKGEVGLAWGERAHREVKNCRRDRLDRKPGVPEAGRTLFAVPSTM